MYARCSSGVCMPDAVVVDIIQYISYLKPVKHENVYSPWEKSSRSLI